MTFGSTDGHPHVCNRVKIGLELKDGQTTHLTLYSIPIICEPLPHQPVTFCQDQFEHLAGLNLADPADDDTQLEIDVLIGLNHYWTLTTGELRRGRCRPSCSQYKAWMGIIRPHSLYRPVSIVCISHYTQFNCWSSVSRHSSSGQLSQIVLGA